MVDEPPYDFFDPKGEDLVVPHQPAIAVYENTQGAVAIRQRVDDDEDTVIFVQPEHVEKLVQRLRKVAEQIGE